MRFIILVFCQVCLPLFSMAQANVLFDVPFEACDALDEVSANQALINGDPNCVCGASGMGLRFDGVDDSISYETGVEEILNSDFALSFYFFVQNDPTLTQTVDLVSYGTQCQRDSSLTIRYIQQTKSVRAEIAINNSILFSLIGKVPDGSCWHYLVLNKNDDRLELYVDDVLIAEEPDFDRNFQFKPNAPFTIGSSPCYGINTQLFNGIIDELRFYDRPLVESEVISGNLRPDKIITADQTLFLNEEIDIETGQVCSDFFNWSPSTDLVNDDTTSPTASPDQTVTYQFTVNYGTCISEDSIKISIVNNEDAQCENLYLPNAFTPNNDKRNDLFRISNEFIVDDLISFDIFSKWGELVWSGNNPKDGWDGNYQGKEMNPTTLLYAIEYSCKGDIFNKTGSFLLLR